MADAMSLEDVSSCEDEVAYDIGSGYNALSPPSTPEPDSVRSGQENDGGAISINLEGTQGETHHSERACAAEDSIGIESVRNNIISYYRSKGFNLPSFITDFCDPSTTTGLTDRMDEAAASVIKSETKDNYFCFMSESGSVVPEGQNWAPQTPPESPASASESEGRSERMPSPAKSVELVYEYRPSELVDFEVCLDSSGELATEKKHQPGNLEPIKENAIAYRRTGSPVHFHSDRRAQPVELESHVDDERARSRSSSSSSGKTKIVIRKRSRVPRSRSRSTVRVPPSQPKTSAETRNSRSKRRNSLPEMSPRSSNINNKARSRSKNPVSDERPKQRNPGSSPHNPPRCSRGPIDGSRFQYPTRPNNSIATQTERLNVAGTSSARRSSSENEFDFNRTQYKLNHHQSSWPERLKRWEAPGLGGSEQRQGGWEGRGGYDGKFNRRQSSNANWNNHEYDRHGNNHNSTTVKTNNTVHCDRGRGNSDAKSSKTYTVEERLRILKTCPKANCDRFNEVFPTRNKARLHLEKCHDLKYCDVCLKLLSSLGVEHQRHFLEFHADKKDENERSTCPIRGDHCSRYKYKGINIHLSRKHYKPLESNQIGAGGTNSRAEIFS